MTPAQALDKALRAERGRLLAALLARLGDLQRAEDALQAAAESALRHWGRSGVPDRPAAWLIRVAYRKAIDGLRRSAVEGRHAAAMAVLARDEAAEDPETSMEDDRLRLIFTCCHPVLEPKSRVALTLRCVAGLTTAEIARAFLDNETTMGQRLSRARARIGAAGIPFALPEAEDWHDRLQSVLAVVYLIFTAGHAEGGTGPRDLCAEAIYLARLLTDLAPGMAEVEGCLALLLLTHARAPARRDAAGVSIALADQDRRLWDAAALADGRAVLDRALARGTPGPFQLKAAIAACHSGGVSDWPQILALYDRLLRMEPTPVVALNRAVALAEVAGPEEGLAALAPLATPLEGFQSYHAARADFLARAGRTGESRAAYDRAIALSPYAADAAFLGNRRDRLLPH